MNKIMRKADSPGFDVGDIPSRAEAGKTAINHGLAVTS